MTDLFREAEEANVTIEYCRIPLNESLSAPGDNGGFVLMDYSLIGTGANERVHLLHEMGHCMTGSFYNRYAKLDLRRRHENRANKWAVKRTITAEELDEAVAEGYCEMWELAEHFNVTEEFMKKAVCWHTYGNLAVEEYMGF